MSVGNEENGKNSDSEYKEWAKKENERESLRLFLEAYREATGEHVEFEQDSETPDFLCRDPNHQ